MAGDKLPSTLTGSPIASLVPPGNCQFGETKTAVPLLERFKISPTSSVMRFGLPDPTKPLNLSTCACILAHAKIGEEDVTRPYTPISTNEQVGSFDLLVKDYGPEAKMSHLLCETLDIGATVQFSHIPPNVKIQAPFDAEEIVMLVGGTGITPMIQALHAILGAKDCTTKVTMLYGSRHSGDILGSDVLHKWAETQADQFTLVDVLSAEPKDSDWQGRRGFIDKALIQEFAPRPDSSKKFIFFVCGPPPLYDALCGPRQEKDKVSGVLGELGYQPEHVYKF